MQEVNHLFFYFCTTKTPGSAKIINKSNFIFIPVLEPEDHWSSITHLSAEDMLKSAVTEEMKFKNIESE